MTRQTRSLLAVIASAVIASTLAGCATNTADCGPDWFAIGQRDGRLGATHQDEYYAARCAAPVDHARYGDGWQAGFAQRPLPGW
jgi:hypothetical protein